MTNINSMAIGLADTSSGYASFVANRENNASGNHAAAFGYHSQAPSYEEFVLGQFASSYTPVSTIGFNGNDRMFNVGNGTGITATSDAFTILKNGKTGIGNSTPAEKLDVVGNIKSTDTVKTAKFRMTNGATNGYVLTGDATGNAKWTSPNSLGVTETDPQVTSSVTYKIPRWNGTTLVDGSMYDSSGKVGINTLAPGATLDVAGNASIGGANLVTGSNALAAGYMDTATGYASFAANRNNNASGNHSAAFGAHSQALSYVEFVIGQYATPYAPASTIGFNANDRMFNVGNGASAAAPADAFTILKNGKTGIGNNTPAEKLDVTGNIKSTDTVKTAKFKMTNGATAGYILTSDAVGNATWTLPAATGTTNTLTASGTNVTSTVNGVAATLNIVPAINAAETDPQVSSSSTNKVPKWNGTTLVDGLMYDNGTSIGINTTLPGATLDVNGITRISGSTAANLELNSPSTATIYPHGTLTPTDQNLEVRSAGGGTLELNYSNNGSIQMAAGGGAVLIGNGTTAYANLDVNGTVKIGTTGTALNSIVRAGVGLTGSTSAPAYSAFTLSFTVNGATTTGTATVSPTAPLSTGFVISSVYVSAANVVSVNIQNVTNSTLVFNYPSFFVTVIN